MERRAIARLRWRRRGAWQWPTFGMAVVGEAVLLQLLPIADGTGVAAGVLLAGFLNVAILAGAAPLGGIVVRRRRPDLPRVVARDYAATGLMVVAAAGVAALGIAHRPAVRAAAAAFRAQSDAVRAYVALHAPAAYRERVDGADSWRMDTDLYRTCGPGPDPARRLCLIVNTAISPPGITIDPSMAPNATFIGRGG
jgi:hypothetical protein